MTRTTKKNISGNSSPTDPETAISQIIDELGVSYSESTPPIKASETMLALGEQAYREATNPDGKKPMSERAYEEVPSVSLTKVDDLKVEPIKHERTLISVGTIAELPIAVHKAQQIKGACIVLDPSVVPHLFPGGIGDQLSFYYHNVRVFVGDLVQALRRDYTTQEQMDFGKVITDDEILRKFHSEF